MFRQQTGVSVRRAATSHTCQLCRSAAGTPPLANAHDSATARSIPHLGSTRSPRPPHAVRQSWTSRRWRAISDVPEVGGAIPAVPGATPRRLREPGVTVRHRRACNRTRAEPLTCENADIRRLWKAAVPALRAGAGRRVNLRDMSSRLALAPFPAAADSCPSILTRAAHRVIGQARRRE